MLAQIVLGGDEREDLLITARLADERIEPFRALIPPMTEQLGIVRRQDQRRHIHRGGEVLDLIDAGAEEMRGVFAGRLERRVSVIGLLRTGATGNAMILETGEAANFRNGQVSLNIVKVEVEPDVAVEVAIPGVPWIPFVLRPDLFGGIKIAAENGDAVRGEEGREYAAARAGRGIEHAVRIGDKPADVWRLQCVLQAVHVGT